MTLPPLPALPTVFTTTEGEVHKLLKAYGQQCREAALTPDCRTCTHHYDNKWCSSKVLCTNGNQYKEAPKVVLWRTQ